MQSHVIQSILFFSASVVFFFLGIIVYRDSPKLRLNRTTGVLLLLVAFATIMAAIDALLPLSAQKDWRFSFWGQLIFIWELFFPLLFYFSLIFPREKKLRHHTLILIVLLLPYVLRSGLLLLFPSGSSLLALFDFSPPQGSWKVLLMPLFLISRFVWTALSYFYQTHGQLFALLNLIYALLSVLFLLVSQKKLAGTPGRRQTGVFIYGLVVALILLAGAKLLPNLFYPALLRPFNSWPVIIAVYLGLFAIVWAIVRFQFLSVRWVIRQGLIFSLSASVIVALFCFLYAESRPIRDLFADLDLPVVEIFIIIIGLYFFQPLSQFIESLFNRLLPSQPADYQEAMYTITRDLIANPDTVNLSERILAPLMQNLDADPVHLLLQDESGRFYIGRNAGLPDMQEAFTADGALARLLLKTNQPLRRDKIRFLISDEQELQLLERYSCHIVVPFIHHEKLYGCLCVGPKRNGKSYTSRDLKLLEAFSSQITMALENVHLYGLVRAQRRLDEELSLAREIQRKLLPLQNPGGASFEFAALNMPSIEVGGDYYDFLHLQDGRIGIAIADISGKGIPGSLLMANLQASVRAAAFRYSNAHDVVAEVNRQLVRTTSAEKYATFFYAIFDEPRRRIHYCNAGHNYPVLKRKNQAPQLLYGGGPIIGVEQAILYHESALSLQNGDCIVFYTDGITEGIDEQGNEFGEQRLFDVIERHQDVSAQQLLDAIYAESIQFSGKDQQADDITLIILRLL
ncbi:PP2C family protein-serine/threonine phosphatase [candidate division KSB1 bacterium]|nr:PP2C family protein-serine/threonine phosphatase [candidate division KSB1 bacterium]